MDFLLIQANAKINLDLKILKRLPNGYHQIESIFQSIDLSDFLLFEKPGTRANLGAGSKNNQFSGAIVCPEPENIILKAQKTLEELLDKSLPCKIHLQKSIPIAAGLGGGSADGAAVLLALNLLYDLKLSKKELSQIGAKIGADVPFFFYGGTCQIEGIGEKIFPIKKKLPQFFVLFRPHKRVETRKMYELYDKTGKDFFTLTKEICPDVKKLEKYLKNFPLKEFGLSGSGPTIFSGVNDYKLAKKIAENFLDFNGDIFICRPQNKALNIIKSK